MSLLCLDNQAATERLGRAAAARLGIGEAICLFGPLGAGKSTMARALIRLLTADDEEVPSPTFSLVQTYEGRDFPISHFDFYRLRTPEETEELGLREALRFGAAVIEWPERLGPALPPDRLEIHLAAGESDQGRTARTHGFGGWSGRDRFDDG